MNFHTTARFGSPVSTAHLCRQFCGAGFLVFEGFLVKGRSDSREACVYSYNTEITSILFLAPYRSCILNCGDYTEQLILKCTVNTQC